MRRIDWSAVADADMASERALPSRVSGIGKTLDLGGAWATLRRRRTIRRDGLRRDAAALAADWALIIDEFGRVAWREIRRSRP